MAKKQEYIPMTKMSLDDAISRPKDDSKDKVTILHYDAAGKAFSPNEIPEDHVAAIMLISKDHKNFKIKAERNGKLYNPLNTSINYGLDKRDKTTNEAMFKLKNVSSKCFQNYIKFLTERHDSLLFIAERENM